MLMIKSTTVHHFNNVIGDILVLGDAPLTKNGPKRMGLPLS